MLNEYELEMLQHMDYLWNKHNKPSNYTKPEMIKYLSILYKAADYKYLLQEIPDAIKMLK